MKNTRLHLIVVLLISFISESFSQNTDFTYLKGRKFDSISAFNALDPLNVSQISNSVLIGKKIPKSTQSVSYRLHIPEYECGFFFSRDNREGDYQWPNNTNRLLTWHFNQLKELADKAYKGIPSNSKPSLLGDALLLKLSNGEYLLLKAIAGKNSLSWFKVSENGEVTLSVSTLGKDYLNSEIPLLVKVQQKSLFDAFRVSAEIIAGKSSNQSRLRENKSYFEAFKYLGWCTWEHYFENIDEQKLINDLDAIQKGILPIRYVLIDDGHLQFGDKKLKSCVPDSIKFPNAWAKIIGKRSEDKIRWMGVWHCFTGYWNGISIENAFGKAMNENLYRKGDILLPGESAKQTENYYFQYLDKIKKYGFDFVKMDNQSFALPLYMGGEKTVERARNCNIALEKGAHQLGLGLINCMAQNTLNIDNTLFSNITRVSIDYKKFNVDMARSHILQSYINTLLQGQTVWPDHDMFHSSDTLCADLMARSKAISGGPVYLSDSPADIEPEVVYPLIDEQGRLFRPEAPAVPFPDFISEDPIYSDKSFRVFAPTGNDAMTVICYNLNHGGQPVSYSISKNDYLQRNAMLQHPQVLSPNTDLLLYDWHSRKAEMLTDKHSGELVGFKDRMFHIVPIVNGLAVIGLQNKYLSPSTVRIVKRSPDSVTVDILASGTLAVAVCDKNNVEIRTFDVTCEAGKSKRLLITK